MNVLAERPSPAIKTGDLRSKRDPAKVANHATFADTFKAADLQPLLDAAAKYGAIKSSFPAADIVSASIK